MWFTAYVTEFGKHTEEIALKWPGFYRDLHNMQKLAQQQRQLWQLANVSNLSKLYWSCVYIQQHESTDFFHHFFRSSFYSYKVKRSHLESSPVCSYGRWSAPCEPCRSGNPWQCDFLLLFVHQITVPGTLSTTAWPPSRGFHQLHTARSSEPQFALWREKEEFKYPLNPRNVHPKLLLTIQYGRIHGLMGLLLLTNEKL